MATTVRSNNPDEFAEQSSLQYTVTQITKPDGSILTPTEPGLTLTLTLYALDEDHTIINGLDHENILNVSRGTLSSLGELVIVLKDADNALVDTTLSKERHVMLIQAEWTNGGAARHEYVFTVVNLLKVPA